MRAGTSCVGEVGAVVAVVVVVVVVVVVGSVAVGYLHDRYVIDPEHRGRFDGQREALSWPTQ